ncbi:MAG: DUF1972 domain-containing protein [Clostridia bacterium]|nr:DUF1972 domain-containing protein [Clostridia bacterium]
MSNVQHVFCIGAKSLGKYGGYETFIDKLTAYHQEDGEVQYHVACKANGDGCMDPAATPGAQIIDEENFIYHNARCFRIPVPEKLGPAQAIYYDLAAFLECLRIIRREKIEHPIVYIMTCRIGPFIGWLYRALHRLGGRVFLNPDGHEWKRAKWAPPVRAYWKYSERRMVKFCDLAICDSKNIERYIHESYDGKGMHGASPKTTFIAYGAETRPSALADDDARFCAWLKEKGLEKNGYDLIVGRFVPENNYETMIREYMASRTRRKLAIITNVNQNFLDDLESRLHFRQDPRICFVGTVYDQELLMKIRENAHAYFHGHEVGGTNPSLLEALGSTPLNLLLNVCFNSEVGQDAALYWEKAEGSLAALINQVDGMPEEERAAYGQKAKARIREAYSWPDIAAKYKSAFCDKP